MPNKQERKNFAKAHTEWVKINRPCETKISVDNTDVLRWVDEPSTVTMKPAKDGGWGSDGAGWGIINQGVVEQVFERRDMYPTDKIGVLDFASYVNPGGGFINGSMAQEEAICYGSNLYNILSNERFTSEYAYNRAHYNDGAYGNWGLYVPDVIFFGDADDPNDDDVEADVLVMPAPNWKRLEENGYDKKFNEKVMYDRIYMALLIFASRECKRLILGAWGCGVFGQSPTVVAHLFAVALKTFTKDTFDSIIFAIPESARDNNYKVFREILMKELGGELQ